MIRYRFRASSLNASGHSIVQSPIVQSPLDKIHVFGIHAIGICIALLLALSHSSAYAQQPPILADFDDGLPIGFTAIIDGQDLVESTLVVPGSAGSVPERPGQVEQNQAVKIDFTTEGVSGPVHAYIESSKSWFGYSGIGFWFYGSGSGDEYQFEILDNRAEVTAGPETAERYEVRFVDSAVGWRQLRFSFTDFRRATDFQNDAAPQDGFALTEVTGYALFLPAGSDTIYLDDVQLLADDPLADFEADLKTGMFVFPPGDSANVITRTITSVSPSNQLAIPGQAGLNHILEVPYEIEQFGGFTHGFVPVARNWSRYIGISFWFYGEGTNRRYQLEVFDNRAESDLESDTAERFEYTIADTFTGWRFFQIPFEDFVRATDFQPEGAPDDGFGLESIWGYSFSLPLGKGTLRLDEVMLYTFSSNASSNLLADYEDGTPPNFFSFSGDASSVTTAPTVIQATDALSMPSQIGPNRALGVIYDVTDFGGFIQSTGSQPQDWVGFTSIQFWFRGAGEGARYEFELLTNRNPASADPTQDTSERYEYIFTDDIEGWRLIELPFTDFVRASFQPEGAPNDGYTLDEIWGYAITLPQGATVFYMDDITLIRSIAIADYDETTLGTSFSFSGATSTVSETVEVVDTNDIFALPGDSAQNHHMKIQYDVTDFGGWGTTYGSSAQDWSSYSGVSFWFYGSRTWRFFQFEVRDNRADPATDSSEIFEYLFVDNSVGWREIRIPFSAFVRAEDFQPDGAPNDGFNLTEIYGYSITLPQGEGTFYLDNISLTRNAAGLPPALYMPFVTQ